jgi:5-deoxy-glucuronate isomerase
LIEGSVTFTWETNSTDAKRVNPFDYKAWCLHVPKGVKCGVKATEHSELYIQKSVNDGQFEPKLYTPGDTRTLKAGAKGELDGTMRRNIRTIFDYDIAPHSNMVLGEVINFPGRWSSYPPHHHPQPEVYYFRYDKPQGFGIGFANGKVYETRHNGLLLIAEKCHSQAAAPGYVLYYIWGIRHLDGNPWIKTRIDDAEHKWLLENDPVVWHEKE